MLKEGNSQVTSCVWCTMDLHVPLLTLFYILHTAVTYYRGIIVNRLTQ